MAKLIPYKIEHISPTMNNNAVQERFTSNTINGEQFGIFQVGRYPVKFLSK